MATELNVGPAEEMEIPSLTQLLRPEVLADPYPLYRQLLSGEGVHWDPYLHTWIAASYESVVSVLRDFSAARTPGPEQLKSMGLQELCPIAEVMVRQMLFLDGAAHARIRSLAASAFTPRRVNVLREHMQGVVKERLDAVESKREMDVIADLADPLPYTITAKLLGVPARDAKQLKKWSQDFAEVLGNFQHNPDRVGEVSSSLNDMTAYFDSAIEETRRNPQEGLIQSFLQAEIEGDRFSKEEIVANAIITMVGGQETTTNLIGNGVLTLLRNPDSLNELRKNHLLIPSAIEEMLRFEPPSQQTARLAPEDVVLGGKQVRKRQAVIALMAAGNRDPKRFADPDVFDIARKNNRHLSFGWAAHFCFGAALARLQGEIVFEELIRRFENWSLRSPRLVWRENLGLRGLTSLMMSFNAGSLS